MDLGKAKQLKEKARVLHRNVPPDWYARSIRENILQRFWHTTRFREVGALIQPSGGKVLDIGSADGTFTKVLLEKSQADTIVGVDVLEKSVAFSRRRFAASKRMHFRVADAHNLPFPDKSFATVFCLETLEHVEDPIRVISEIKRVLRDEGYVVLLVPSENFLFRFIVWPLWGLYRGKIWRGAHLHKFSADKLLGLMEEQGFRVEKNHKFLLGMLQAVKATKK